MKLTKDNFKTELGCIQKSIDNLPKIGIDLVDSSVTRLKDKVTEIRKNAEELLASNQVLRLGVVGQVKAGKSSFLNSLIFDGEDVLPRAATPMTAGLTIIEYGEDNQFEVEFYNISEWTFFEDRAKEYDTVIAANRGAYPGATENDIAMAAGIPDELKAAKELVAATSGKAKSCVKPEAEKRKEKFAGLKDLHGKLAQYVGVDGSYTPVVKALTIRLNDNRLKDIQVVDTPGVNDPIISREEKTRQFLSGCHGVFFLSYSGCFFDATDVSFLVNRIGSQGIGDIVVIASKFDSALQDVGHQFHDNLAGAAEHLENALRQQMNRNIGSSDYRGKTPSFDFSSGIGYSIAKKTESCWDPTERNVVEQMKRFYPSFFSSPEDIKETFLNLAQISDIQEKYLMDFAANKDRIIISKMNNYFATITSEIAQPAKDALSRANNSLQTLKGSTVLTLEKTKIETNRVLRSLQGDVNRLILDCQNDIESITREIENSCRLPINLSIATESKLFHCTRESTFWGRTKRFNVSVDIVHPHTTIKNVSDVWNKLLKESIKLWDERIEKVSSGLIKSIESVVQDAEEKDSESVLDTDLLRDIVKDAIIELKRFKSPGISDLSDLPNKLNFQTVVSFNTFAGTNDESEAEKVIRKRGSINLSAAESILTQFKRNANSDLKNFFQKLAKETKDMLTKKQSTLIADIREKITAYINELEKKIKNNKQEEQKVQSLCDSLKGIVNTILS